MIKSFCLALIQLVLISICVKQVNAQSLGNYRSDIDWQIMRTPVADLVYPKGVNGLDYMRFANLINYQHDSLTQSVGTISRKLTFVFQNQTVIPNGYVGLAPFRSELYATPPEELNFVGGMNWMDALAIHEYRHAQQIPNLLHGLTKFVYYAQGELGWTYAHAISIPAWYFEGDAVWAETSFTNSGRGRSPFFTAQQRTLAQEGYNYSYLKYRNGSFKDLVPNHYRHGYTMISFLRNEQGVDVLNDVIKDAASFKGIIYPFNRSLKKNTGYTTKELHKASLKKFEEDWKLSQSTIELIPTIPVSEIKPKTVTNHFFPQFDENGRVIASRETFKSTDELVLFSSESKQKNIIHLGFNFSNYFYYSKGKYLWTERAQNPRRTNQNYSNVVLYDGKKKKVITKKARLFSPVFGTDNTIFAIQIGEDLIASIEKIDSETGAKTNVLRFQPGVHISRLAYNDQTNTLIFIKVENSQVALWQLNLVTKELLQLTPSSYHVVNTPRIRGDYVYYSASFSGIDNIYRTPLDGSKVIEQLTSVSIGAYQPDVNKEGTILLFTEQTDQGRMISKMDLKFAPKRRIIVREPIEMEWQDKTGEVEIKNMLDSLPTVQYESTDYKGLFKGLKLHSWGLLSSTFTKPELTLSFNNYLNDLSIKSLVNYNINERGIGYGVNASFGRWYPIFTVGGGRRSRTTDYLSNTDTLIRQKFNENYLQSNITVPLTWLKGNYTVGLQPSLSAGIHDTRNRVTTDNEVLGNQIYGIAGGEIDFSILRRTAYQNINSRLGFSTTLSYESNLTFQNQEKIAGAINIYLPGIAKNHSVTLNGGFQKELLNNTFQLQDNFRYTRGFKVPVNDQAFSLSVNYSLPLLYPDFGVLGITYFKRIRANIFYDIGQYKYLDQNKTTLQSSVGTEIIFDNTMLNLNFIVTGFGFRATYLLQNDDLNPGKNFVPEFFISIPIIEGH